MPSKARAIPANMDTSSLNSSTPMDGSVMPTTPTTEMTVSFGKKVSVRSTVVFNPLTDALKPRSVGWAPRCQRTQEDS